MAANNNPFRRFRLVYRRSSTLLKCVILAAIVLSTAAMVTLRFTIREYQDRQQELALQAAQLEQENRTLTKNIAELGTVESIKRIAREELGLVDPDTQFFVPIEGNP